MDQQEGNSTASFGSSIDMAPSETTHVAMVCQTVASDMMSSVGESPAQSSESALDMGPKRDAQRGRASGQCADVQVLPKIAGSDDGSEGQGRGRLPLSQASRESPKGIRSRSPTERQSSPVLRPEKGRLSASGTPKHSTQVEKVSGRSTPKAGKEGITPSKDLVGAEEKLVRLLNEYATCASPGGMSHASQKELPNGPLIDQGRSGGTSSFHTPTGPPISFPAPFPMWKSAAPVGAPPMENAPK